MTTLADRDERLTKKVVVYKNFGNADYARARGSPVGVIVFATSLEKCLKRVQTRTNHPTLTASSPESETVVMRMAESLVFPDRKEGFLFCRVVRNDQDYERVFLELVAADSK